MYEVDGRGSYAEERSGGDRWGKAVKVRHVQAGKREARSGSLGGAWWVAMRFDLMRFGSQGTVI